MKNSHLMWRKWCKAGEPEDLGDPARKRMIEAKQMLRKKQQLEPAKQRNARKEGFMS